MAFLYLGFTSGIVVNWHYCMGDLAAVEWGMDHGTSCSKCGMEDRKGCCETTYQVLKVNDAHLSTKIQAFQSQLSEHTPWELPVVIVTRPAKPFTVRQPVISPPGQDGRKTYLLVQTFLL